MEKITEVPSGGTYLVEHLKETKDEFGHIIGKRGELTVLKDTNYATTKEGHSWYKDGLTSSIEVYEDDTKRASLKIGEDVRIKRNLYQECAFTSKIVTARIWLISDSGKGEIVIHEIITDETFTHELDLDNKTVSKTITGMPAAVFVDNMFEGRQRSKSGGMYMPMDRMRHILRIIHRNLVEQLTEYA